MVLVNPLTVDSKLLTVYPSPAHNNFNLKINYFVGKGEVILLDNLGRVVKQQNLSLGNNNIDISKLSKGMYFVNVITEQSKRIEKLIVE